MGFKRNMACTYNIHRDLNNMLSKHKLVRGLSKPFRGLISTMFKF